MPAPSPLLDALAPHLTPDGLRAALRAALIDVVRENAGQLDATLNESGFIPAGASSTGPGFAAQTSNTEVIEGILITAGTTSSPVANGFTGVGAVPASATPPTYTVPAGGPLTVNTVNVTLATSAVNASRFPELVFYDPAGHLISSASPGNSVPNNLVQPFVFGGSATSYAGYGFTAVPMPPIVLQPGSTITMVDDYGGLQAGDQYSALTVAGTVESTASASGLIVTVGEYTIAVAPDSFDGAMFFLSGLKLVVTQPNRSVAIVSNTPALTPTVLPSPLYVVMWGYAAPASNAPGVLH
jgi:hypothetical protein